MTAVEAPRLSAQLRPFTSSLGAHLFVADGSRIYDLAPEAAACVQRRLACDQIEERPATPPAPPPAAVPLTAPEDELWRVLGLLPADAPPRIDGRPLDPPGVSSISLNVMQACNLSCGYCYADEGRFGGRARSMAPHVARAAVDRLIAGAEEGADLVLGYMGGEPLLARELVHETTRYAARAAHSAGRRIRFSLTTNLTTLRPEDAALFAEFRFTIAVSVDGPRRQHDALRRMRDGSGSYARVVEGLAVLERHGRPRHLAARVTVTPASEALPATLDHVIGMGFDEVGFAAVLVSPNPALAFSPGDFPAFLDQMTACGRTALAELSAGRRYPFGNFETAMAQIHRGTHRPYPCGAGAAYLSASAEGRLFACHRLIDDPAFAMGAVWDGPDDAARAAHLAAGHVDRMEPCRGCWARYLCGGGCYHEVTRRGRIGCDYIRGWLEFCLEAYVELSAARPAYFHDPPSPGAISSPTTVST